MTDSDHINKLYELAEAQAYEIKELKDRINEILPPYIEDTIKTELRRRKMGEERNRANGI